MNWYKQAQLDNKWRDFITGIGKGALIGLIGMLGLAGLQELRAIYEQNPQKIEQALIQTKENISLTPEEAPAEKTVEQKYPGIDISKMIERHEGKRNTVYSDTEGHPTIGIGFNLDRSDAKEKLSNLGVDINKVLNKQQILTDEQIYILFKDDLETAIIDAHNFLPNFESQPTPVQSILINMSFNLGYNKLSGFEEFRKALLNRDYQKAADEMIDSKWYHQVGNRSKELVSIMRGIK